MNVYKNLGNLKETFHSKKSNNQLKLYVTYQLNLHGPVHMHINQFTFADVASVSSDDLLSYVEFKLIE